MPNISISINSAQPPSPRPPVYDRPTNLRRLAHDYQSADDPRGRGQYLPRVFGDSYGLPETEKLGDPTFLPMTLEWCKLWYDLIAYYAPSNFATLPPKGTIDPAVLAGYVPKSRLEEVWLEITGGALFVTNKQGWDSVGDFYDPLTGAGKFANTDKPFKKEGVTTCGNVVWATGKMATGGGTWIWCLDYKKPAPRWQDVVSFQWAIHCATVCDPNQIDPTKTAEAPNGTFQVDHFPKLSPASGVTGNMVPVPLISDRDDAETMVYKGVPLRANWIVAERILPLADSDPVPSPLVPPRPMITTP